MLRKRDLAAIRRSIADGGRWTGKIQGTPISIGIVGEYGNRGYEALVDVKISGQRSRRRYRLFQGTLPELAAELARPVYPAEYQPLPPAGKPRKLDASGAHLLGYAAADVLHWLGAHGFAVFDAMNALEHYGVTGYDRRTVSRALANGHRHPIELDDTAAQALEAFRGMAGKS